MHEKNELNTVQPPWSRLVAGVALRSEALLKRICRELKSNQGEQTAVRRLEGRVG